MRRILVLTTLLLLACARDTISREEWRRMPREDRVLYVKTLVAEEVAKDAKGDRGRVRQRPVEDYVNEIDQAYSRGDARRVDEIFEGLR
ncbi:MAG TPA: hypothetical protein VFP80_14955 [Thermoanaerobaculia bacterium]|nr:hypothetical protein [Thermoanaerobaculia bacterium]